MKNLKRSLIILISFFIFFFGELAINTACGPQLDPYDYYVSFFHNNVAGNNGFSNYYFNDLLALFDEEEPESEAVVNCKEWANQIGVKADYLEILQVMYKGSRAFDSTLVQQLQKGHVSIDTISDNCFVNTLLKKTYRPFRDYFIFSKQVELSTPVIDPWNPEPFDTTQLIKLRESAFNYGKEEKNEFLKNRYYYQACKLSFYTGKYNDVIEIYDRHLSRSNSHTKGWGLALKAGAFRKMGQVGKGAYYFSKVFAEYPERRVQAYKNYHYCQVPVEEVLKYAISDKEKAMVWAIKGFGDPSPSVEYLNNIMRLDPTSELIGLMLVREINKLENSYMTPKLNNPPFSNPYFGWFSDEIYDNEEGNYLAQVRKIALEFGKKGENIESSLGFIGAAYLSWMNGRTEEGWKALENISSNKLSDKLKDQEKIVRLLLSSQEIKDYNLINEEKLIPTLKWLDEKMKSEKLTKNTLMSDSYFYPERFSATVRNFYQLILAPFYLGKGDTATAVLAMVKGDEIGYSSSQTDDFFTKLLSPKSLLKLWELRKSTTLPSFQDFLIRRFKYVDEAFLNELTGTAFLRVHNYRDAISYLEKVPNLKLSWNPFVDPILDYPIVRDSTNRYTKLRFAQEMASLEKMAQTDVKNSSQYYYKMATGLYNASTYTGCWDLISYYWQSSDWGRKPIYYYDKDYIQVKSAEAYYSKARLLSNDKELRARCTFMLAKCYQKQDNLTIGNKYSTVDKAYLLSTFYNPYLKELATEYRSTRFHKIATTECSYYREFLKEKH